MKFKLGDKVRSKGILSPINCGTIVNISAGEFYAPLARKTFPLEIWDRTFPNWENKPVYTVKKGLKIQSIKEEHIPEDMCPHCVEENRLNPHIIFPEDELESYDWIAELEKSI